MAIGEDGRPQGVGVGGMRATGVKGGEGREERPVPPIMAIGTASGGVLVALWIQGRGFLPVYVLGSVSIPRVGFVGSEIERRGLIDVFGMTALTAGSLR